MSLTGQVWSLEVLSKFFELLLDGDGSVLVCRILLSAPQIVPYLKAKQQFDSPTSLEVD